jgi:hypothetical protein
LKKILLMLTFAFFCISSNAYAQIIETGKEVEVKNQAAKTFIYQIFERYVSDNTAQYYHKKYKAKSIGWSGPDPKKVHVWIKEAKQFPGDTRYTHVIRVFVPYEQVTIDNKPPMNVGHTFIYAVNGYLFSDSPVPGKPETRIKLMKHYYKEQR